MSFETELYNIPDMTLREKRSIIKLANAHAELIAVKDEARKRRRLMIPEEMLQEAIVKAQEKFEKARAEYLGMEVL